MPVTTNLKIPRDKKFPNKPTGTGFLQGEEMIVILLKWH